MTDEILTIEQAAARLKMSKEQLYEVCRSRSRSRARYPIPFFKVGKVRRFRASSLDAWIAKLEQEETVQ